MDIRQLQCFLCIAKAGGFSKASRQLHITQPALSRHVRNLEDEIGTKLFHRTSRGVALTDAGRTLSEHTEYIIRYIDDIKYKLANEYSEPKGTVVVGLPQSIAPILAPRLIERARILCPLVNIHLIEGLSVFLIDWLSSGKIDVAVVSDVAIREPSLIHSPIVKEEMVLVGASDKISEASVSIDIADIGRYQLIMSRGFYNIMLNALPKFAGNIEMELDSIMTIKEMVSNGVYFTILPYQLVHRDRISGQLKILSFSPPVYRHLVIALNSRRPVASSLECIRGIITREMQSIKPWTHHISACPAP